MNRSSIALSVFLMVALSLPKSHGQFADSSDLLDLPIYVPVPEVIDGSLRTVGSDTMNIMMSYWIEEFRRQYPNVRAEVDAKGSSNALPALIGGQANLGLMSRAPKKGEIMDFKSRYGYEPTVLPTSIDMLAVCVHRDNPIQGLSFPELDSIFSSTRKLGANRRAVRWGDLLEGGPFSHQPITCFGRNAASGTYAYFKDAVLQRGDYGAWVNELAGSSNVAQSVGANLGGIGYSGIGFQNANVKVIPIGSGRGGPLIEPTAKNAYDGSYPLSRLLYIVINHDPRLELDAMRREFLKYVFSRQGQEQVIRAGYLPLNVTMAQDILALVEQTP